MTQLANPFSPIDDDQLRELRTFVNNVKVIPPPEEDPLNRKALRQFIKRAGSEESRTRERILEATAELDAQQDELFQDAPTDVAKLRRLNQIRKESDLASLDDLPAKQTAGEFAREGIFTKENIPIAGDIIEGIGLYSDLTTLRDAVERMGEGKETLADLLAIAEFQEESAKRVRGQTIGAAALEGVTQSIIFGTEFALSGGLLKLLKLGPKVVSVAAKKTIAGKLGAVLTNAIKGTIARSPIIGGATIGAATLRRRFPEVSAFRENEDFQIALIEPTESFTESLTAAGLDTIIEIFSEQTGQTFAVVGAPLRALGGKLLPSVARAGRRIPALRISDRQFLDKLGISTIFGEAGEERIGDALRLGFKKLGVDLDSGLLGQAIELAQGVKSGDLAKAAKAKSSLTEGSIVEAATLVGVGGLSTGSRLLNRPRRGRAQRQEPKPNPKQPSDSGELKPIPLVEQSETQSINKKALLTKEGADLVAEANPKAAQKIADEAEPSRRGPFAALKQIAPKAETESFSGDERAEFATLLRDTLEPAEPTKTEAKPKPVESSKRTPIESSDVDTEFNAALNSPGPDALVALAERRGVPVSLEEARESVIAELTPKDRAVALAKVRGAGITPLGTKEKNIQAFANFFATNRQAEIARDRLVAQQKETKAAEVIEPTEEVVPEQVVAERVESDDLDTDADFDETLSSLGVVSADDLLGNLIRKIPLVKAFFKREFTSKGDLPLSAFSRNRQREAAIEAKMRRIGFGVREFNRAAKLAFGGRKKMTPLQIKDVSIALTSIQDIDEDREFQQLSKARRKTNAKETKQENEDAVVLALAKNAGVPVSIADAQAEIIEDLGKINPKQLIKVLELNEITPSTKSLFETDATARERNLIEIAELLAPERRIKMSLTNVVTQRRLQATQRLPEVMRGAVEQLRREIDAGSKELLDTGLLQGDIRGTVEENIGIFIHRTFRTFTTPDWAERVPPEIRNKAIAVFRKEFPNDTEEELEGRVDRELIRGKESNSPIAMIHQGKLGSKDLSMMKRRGKFGLELRNVWGQNRNPLTNYIQSSMTLAYLVENQKFLEDVALAGEGVFLFKKATTNKDGKFVFPIANSKSKAMAPLSGFFTEEKTLRAFEDALDPSVITGWFKAYMRLNSIVKYSKTVASHVTHIRNLGANMGFAIAHGHWRAWKAGESIKLVATSLGIGDRAGNVAARRDRFIRLVELGVVSDNARQRELEETIKDIDRQNMTVDQFAEWNARNALRKIGRIATEIYRAEDDVWKIFAFENEKARYRKALPELNEEQLEELSARRVVNSYPTYSLISSGFRKIRRFPIFGTFVSFPAEVYRTTWQWQKIMREDMSDPRTRGIGMQRIAGGIAVVAIPAALAAGFRAIYGVTADDDEDLREFGPSWSENSTLLRFGPYTDDPLKSDYIDFSYVDPFNYLRKPIILAIRGIFNEKEADRIALDAMFEALEPFISEEILISAILDIKRNKIGDTTRRVYNPEDDRGERFTDVMKHLMKTVEPGTITSLRRLQKGLAGTVEYKGKAYNPKLEAIAQFGQRVSTIDIPTSLGFDAGEYNSQRRNIAISFGEVIKNRGTVSKSDVRDAVEKTDKRFRRRFNQMLSKVEKAQRQGMTRQALSTLLKEKGTGKELVYQLMSGDYQEHPNISNMVYEMTGPTSFKDKKTRKESIRRMNRLLDGGMDKKQLRELLIRETKWRSYRGPALLPPTKTPGTTADRLDRLNSLIRAAKKEG